LIGTGQIINTVGSTCWSILSAQGRVRLATVLEIVVSWLLVLPLSCLFIFYFDFNLLGLVAAVVLGYSVGGVASELILLRSDWDALGARVVLWSGTPATSPDDYDDDDWDELPPHIQTAANVLGYTAEMWDHDKSPDNLKDWKDLTPAERDAATLLGYNATTWDDDDDGEDESTAEDESFSEWSWKKLPPKVRAAAMILGYTEKLWEEDESPPTEEKYWNELTPEQQEAATTLGYTEQSWNAVERNSTVESQEEAGSCAMSDMDDADWDELPAEIRNAAIDLGYTEDIWNKDANPASNDKYWKELTPKEQLAARVLGYTKEKWDVEDDSSSSSDESGVV